MTFDFTAFLAELDPTVEYELKILSGGLVNQTARARKASTNPAGGRFPGNQHLILKYAPPFIAAVGEAAPFSQGRQDIEARAISYLTAPDGVLSSIPASTSISVPRVLHHDTERHVLVFEDLGPWVVLDDYLNKTFSREKSSLSSEQNSLCQQIGLRIGQFFAQVHHPKSLLQIQQESAASTISENPFTSDLVYNFAVLPIQEHLQKYDIDGADVLFARVAQDYKRPSINEERCFISGDFTPGTILVGPTSGDGGMQPLGVIDWEFSGVGRGPNGDMPQCLATLHLMLRTSPLGTAARSAIAATVDGICSAYSQSLAEWLPMKRPDKGPSKDMRFLQVFRSALILHGREMINNAIDREWPDDSDVSVAEMVNLGSWYLRVAGDDVLDMIKEENWQQLLKEDHGVMLRLFGLAS